jgi:hypothetical protein
MNRGFAIVFLIFLTNCTSGQIKESDSIKCKNNPVDTKCIGSSFTEYFSSIKGLDCYFDFDEGLQCAKILNLPCLVYFTGHNSIPSRKMESELLANNDIIRSIRGNYVFIMLFKDDKMKLPPLYQVISSISNDTITLFGEKSIYYQKRLFNEDVHPAFYIIDLKKDQLTSPVYYGATVKEFKRSLNEGITGFKSQNNKPGNRTDFTLRVHRNDDELDKYRLKGTTGYEDFVKLFKTIDWEAEFFIENENGNFNFSSIEVMNERNSLYLLISTAASDNSGFQYIVGIGYHQTRIEQVSRSINLYGSGTTDQDKMLNLIELFFCNDIGNLMRELEKFDFLATLDDIYDDF